MKIDRHNYEDYFILYWDNELPEDQKLEVEKFVSENDDLRDEFRLLGKTRFSPDDTIQYAYKNFLLNTGDESVNVSNYKDQLLSYIDNELTPVQQKQLEEFVSIHPAAHKELSQLQKVKLEPETEITFPEKSILYRREIETPVFRLTWLRVAVAAAVIIMAGLVTFRLTTAKQNNGPNEFALKQKPVENTSGQEGNKPNPPSVTDNTNVNSNTAGGNTRQELQTTASNEQSAVITKTKAEKKKPLVEKNITDQPLIAQTEAPQNPNEETFLLEPKKTYDEAVAFKETEKKSDPFANAGVTERPSPSYTLYNESPKEGGGFKEFLRKTTRMIERRTKLQTTTDDNKLLVGAFAVSL